MTTPNAEIQIVEFNGYAVGMEVNGTWLIEKLESGKVAHHCRKCHRACVYSNAHEATIAGHSGGWCSCTFDYQHQIMVPGAAERGILIPCALLGY